MNSTWIIFGIIVLYFFPYITAKSRHKKNAVSVLVLNVFLGWTLVGWVVALVMAYNPDPESLKVVEHKSNIVQDLDKLATLKEKGIITDEEFNAQKKKLLS